MAAEHRKPFFLFRPGFVMFCLYIAAYCWMRSVGDIALQSVPVTSPRGVEMFRMIGPSIELAHWRQQVYRALFSLPMVVEEEGRKHEGTVRRLYHEARGTAGVVGEAVGHVRDNAPIGQQQYPQQQYQPPQYQQQQYPQQQYPQQQYQQQQQYQPQQQLQQTRYPSQQQPMLNEGERLIYMPTPQEQRQAGRGTW